MNTSDLPKIAFVGVGRMGANMAYRLKGLGYPVAAIYDKRDEIAGEVGRTVNAYVAKSLGEVTQRADVIITVVSDDAAMQEVFSRDGDSLLRGARGKTFVNCATISPQLHVHLETLLNEHAARSLEVCMAGSISQARNGSLYFIVSGDPETLELMQPILSKMSAAMRYVGKSGNAATVKALVNMVMNINTAGLAEGLGLGAALGIDLTVLRDIFSQTGANSRVLETDGEDMQRRDHDVYFSASHAAKDSGIALALARDIGLQLVLAEATKQQYDKMVELSLGEIDKSGIAELTFPGRTLYARSREA